MVAGSTFPTTLDTFTTKIDKVSAIVVAETNLQSSALEKLQAKVGIDSSAVTTSHDYKLQHTINDTGNQTVGGVKTFSSAPAISALTASELMATDASKNVQSLAVATYPSLTEIARIKGLSSAVQTQLNAKPTVSSSAGAPASTPSAIGDEFLDTTANRWYKAKGTSSSADWVKVPVYTSGTLTISAGGGDQTVNLPWDWTGGYLELIISRASGNWAEPTAATGFCTFIASYDSLTNAGYTNNQVIGELANGASSQLGGGSKSDNTHAKPKSATTTSFTLEDGDITYSGAYVKWFVWA